MQQSILYVGLDVDATQDHGSARSHETGAVLNVLSPLGRVKAPAFRRQL
jgi:hypothetical protein